MPVLTRRTFELARNSSLLLTNSYSNNRQKLNRIQFGLRTAIIYPEIL